METRPANVVVQEIGVTVESRGRPVAALDRISLGQPAVREPPPC
jgi:hypothetical protein